MATEEPSRKRSRSPEAEDTGRPLDARKQPRYGNYRNYYGKRRYAQDPTAGDLRLAQLPREWIEHKRVLDIGCNVGKVTLELAQTRAPYRVVGVDIDKELIQLAKKQLRLAWSRGQPLQAVLDLAAEYDSRSVSSTVTAAAVPATEPAQPNYFPLSLPRMFGFLPEPPSTALRSFQERDEAEAAASTRRRDGREGRGKVPPREVRAFPDNLKFSHADWVVEDLSDDRKGYDLILALSVSKWIHLNHGDKGLRDWFARIFECLRPRGRFVLEPQPWSSYTKAKRMADDLRESYDALVVRPDDFERILLDEIGFEKMELIGEIGEGGFKRPLQVYVKSGGSWI